MYFLEVCYKYTSTVLQTYILSILYKIRVHLSQWITIRINLNCLYAPESQRGITFNHQVTRNHWYSLDLPLKDERLRQFFSYLIVFEFPKISKIIYIFFKVRSILKIYFISKKSRSINEVLLNYKQSTFFLFCFHTSFMLLFRKFT